MLWKNLSSKLEPLPSTRLCVLPCLQCPPARTTRSNLSKATPPFSSPSGSTTPISTALDSNSQIDRSESCSMTIPGSVTLSTEATSSSPREAAWAQCRPNTCRPPSTRSSPSSATSPSTWTRTSRRAARRGVGDPSPPPGPWPRPYRRSNDGLGHPKPSSCISPTEPSRWTTSRTTQRWSLEERDATPSPTSTVIARPELGTCRTWPGGVPLRRFEKGWLTLHRCSRSSQNLTIKSVWNKNIPSKNKILFWI